jgi:hypothetical protein
MESGTADTERWRYFSQVQLWPIRGKFDPDGWMENFQSDEIPLARRLLEGFTFYSAPLVAQMFRTAFGNLSQLVITQRSNYLSAKAEWTRFVNSSLFVRVTGEIPSEADSGFIFTRLARDILRIDEHQILPPQEVLQRLLQHGQGNVIFVDDFVGSGNQFCETWNRAYTVGHISTSFQALANSARGSIRYFYVPLICTEKGRDRLATDCPQVKIVPAHFFGPKQSALSSESEIWREDMRTEGPNFVEAASLRAGIPDMDGNEGCWQGFHKLGLCLAFEHGWPDATLPLFYSTNENWKPLIKRGAL